MATLDKAKTLEEKRAALIIQYRKLAVDAVEKEEEKITYRLSRGDEKFLMHILLNKKTIGISFIRDLKDQIDAEGYTGGIIVGDGVQGTDQIFVVGQRLSHSHKNNISQLRGISQFIFNVALLGDNLGPG